MPYSKWNPDPHLAPFVESLWLQESPSDPEPVAPTRILPVGRVDMVVQFGDPFVRVDNGEETRVPSVHLTGQRTRTLSVRATGRTGLVLVNFLPWGASAIFEGLDAHLDGSPDLGDFVGRGPADRLGDAVHEAASAEERIRAVQRFLLDRLTRRRPDPLAVEAALRLRRWKDAQPVASVAASLGLSRRHLVRVFRRTVGMPPKAFARVVRFQQALGLRRSGFGWSETAHACGYADQAHLGHEVSRLSGTTPSDLEQHASRRRLGRYFNTVQPSRFYNTIYV